MEDNARGHLSRGRGVDRVRRGVAGPDGLAMGFHLNSRVQKHGLPHMAWWLISTVAVFGGATATAAYVATHHFFAPIVLLGMTWLFVVMIAYMADLNRRIRSSTPD